MTAPIRNTTKRLSHGQIVICLGCCCGRTDKGHPPVPVDLLKAEWKRRKLLKHVQLTIAGCIGPCDASNAVLVFLGDEPVWLGGLHLPEHYRALLDWAVSCQESSALQPLPRMLLPHRIEERFRTAAAVELAAAV